MIRLLIAEGHPVIRRGLEMWLRLAPDITVVGEAGDSLSALWQAAMIRPHVVLVHLHAAGLDDSKLIDALRRAAPGSEIVVLSLYDDARTRRRFLAAGAAAFVSMHGVKEQLLQAVRRAAGLPRPDEQTDRSGQAPATLKASGEV
jgi:DNA-binding NarL/FixJ family response regulator